MEGDFMINDADVKLTSFAKTSGWAAKVKPEVLDQILKGLEKSAPDPNLLVGLETSDDAAVYKVSEDRAIIETLDFFTPIVDDPYTFCLLYTSDAADDCCRV